MEIQQENELKFISEGSAKIYEEGNVFYNPVQEVNLKFINYFNFHQIYQYNISV